MSGRNLRNRKRQNILIVVVSVAICVVAAVVIYRTLFSEVASEDVYVSSVSTLMGNLENGMRNRYQGVVESNKTWSLKIEPERPILEYKVKVGDKVKKGDEILVYDNSEKEKAIETARLELQRMQDDLAETNAEINELSAEKNEQDEIEAAQTAIDIQQKQLDMRNKSYDIESKKKEIYDMELTLENPSVYCDINGVVKSLGDDGESDSVTVVNTGSFQVKARVNEQNLSSLYKDEPMIIYSRVSDDLSWKGKISKIDKEHKVKVEEDYDEAGDEMTSSTNYPFYISLKDRSGLTVGQHVYVEEDVGQLEDADEEVVELVEYMIVDADTDSPYVWADDGHGHLEKRSVMLGEYNKKAKRYRVVEGLSMTDLLAQPEEDLRSGMSTINMDEQDEDEEDADSEDDEDEDDGPDDLEDYEDELGAPVFD